MKQRFGLWSIGPSPTTIIYVPLWYICTATLVSPVAVNSTKRKKMQNSLGKASKIQRIEILKYPFDWRAGVTVVTKQNIQESSESEGKVVSGIQTVPPNWNLLCPLTVSKQWTTSQIITVTDENRDMLLHTKHSVGTSNPRGGAVTENLGATHSQAG